MQRPRLKIHTNVKSSNLATHLGAFDNDCLLNLELKKRLFEVFLAKRLREGSFVIQKSRPDRFNDSKRTRALYTKKRKSTE